MKKKNLLKYIICLLAFLLSPGTCLAKSVSVLELFGKTAADQEIRIYIDRSKGRYLLKRKLGSILILPPYNRKIALNPENKLFLVTNLRGMGPERISYICSSKVNKVGPTKLLGKNCSVYSFRSRFVREKLVLYKAELVTTRDLKVPESLCNAISTVSGAPANKGFPLQYYAYRAGRKDQKVVVFQISKIKKSVADDNIFSIPKGYKRAKSYASFFFSSGGELDKHQMDELFRSSPR